MELGRKRVAVFGYRLMFSPETQPIKQTIVAQIVLTQLAESANDDGESIGKLKAFRVNGVNVLNFSFDETRAALASLVSEGLAEEFMSRKKKRWRITTAGRKTITDGIAGADQRISTVVEKLFGSCKPTDQYRSAFLECLGDIFDRFAQRYVEASFSEIDKLSTLPDRDTNTIANEVIVHYQDLDAEEFTSGVRRFLEESHPDSDWLKWTYCKNYYSVRIIGVGEHSEALSAAVFSGMKAYLDTNVLIDSLDASSPTHEAVNQILDRFREIGCEVAVLRVTIRELQDFARNQRYKLETVLRQIPDALLGRTRGIVARTEASHRKDSNQPSPAEVLSDLENANNLVAERLGLEIVDDDWFDGGTDLQEMTDLADALQTHYDQSRPFGRHKTDRAAKHDALALHWICEARSKGENCTFVTLDSSLPTFPVSSKASSEIKLKTAITVEALLPWLGMVSEDEEGVSKAYSALLSNRLIAVKQTLDINEFRMLAEIGMDCGQMPAESIEQCLSYLRHEAKGTDLRNAEDREKLHYKVKSFFSSPDQKFLSAISSLEEQVSEKDRSLERLAKNKEEEADRFRNTIAEYKHQVLVGKTKQRLTVVAGVLVVSLLVSIWVSENFGAGENVLQRVGNTWWLFGLVVTGSGLLLRALCAGGMWSTAKRILHFPESLQG